MNSTWLITSELANQHAGKVLFTCVVYTNVIYQTQRPCLTTFLKSEKRVEYMVQSRVFLKSHEVFGNIMKHCLECLIYLLGETKEKMEK